MSQVLVPYLTLHNNNNSNNLPLTENFITEEVNVDVNIVCVTVWLDRSRQEREWHRMAQNGTEFYELLSFSSGGRYTAV